MLTTPFGMWFALRFDFGAVRRRHLGLLVVYALAASIWTVWLWMTGLQSVPASQAGVFTVMLPVSAAVVGVLRARRDTFDAAGRWHSRLPWPA